MAKYKDFKLKVHSTVSKAKQKIKSEETKEAIKGAKETFKKHVNKENAGKAAKSAARQAGACARCMAPIIKGLFGLTGKITKCLLPYIFRALKWLIKQTVELLVSYIKYSARFMIKCSKLVVLKLVRCILVMLRAFGSSSKAIFERFLYTCMKTSTGSCLANMYPRYCQYLNEKYAKNRNTIVLDTSESNETKEPVDEQVVMFNKKTSEVKIVNKKDSKTSLKSNEKESATSEEKVNKFDRKDTSDTDDSDEDNNDSLSNISNSQSMIKSKSCDTQIANQQNFSLPKRAQSTLNIQRNKSL